MRAYKVLGTFVPKKSKTTENTEDNESQIIENRKPQGGGKRKDEDKLIRLPSRPPTFYQSSLNHDT